MWFAILLANGEQVPAGAPGWVTFAPLIAIGLLFWMLLLRPAQKQEQQRRAMVAALKKNDRIVNSGGIIGIVESIKDKEDEVVLRGGLRITKSSISRVLSQEDAGKDQKDGGA